MDDKNIQQTCQILRFVHEDLLPDRGKGKRENS
jgi:hypothetical protein